MVALNGTKPINMAFTKCFHPENNIVGHFHVIDIPTYIYMFHIFDMMFGISQLWVCMFSEVHLQVLRALGRFSPVIDFWGVGFG